MVRLSARSGATSDLDSQREGGQWSVCFKVEKRQLQASAGRRRRLQCFCFSHFQEKLGTDEQEAGRHDRQHCGC